MIIFVWYDCLKEFFYFVYHFYYVINCPFSLRKVVSVVSDSLKDPVLSHLEIFLQNVFILILNMFLFKKTTADGKAIVFSPNNFLAASFCLACLYFPHSSGSLCHLPRSFIVWNILLPDSLGNVCLL